MVNKLYEESCERLMWRYRWRRFVERITFGLVKLRRFGALED